MLLQPAPDSSKQQIRSASTQERRQSPPTQLFFHTPSAIPNIFVGQGTAAADTESHCNPENRFSDQAADSRLTTYAGSWNAAVGVVRWMLGIEAFS